jgi:hypothetical protein
MRSISILTVVTGIVISASVAFAGHGGGGGGHGGKVVVKDVVPGNQQQASKTSEKNIVASGTLAADTARPGTVYFFTADDGTTYALKGSASEIAGLATFKDKRVQIIGKAGEFNGDKYIKMQSVKEAPPKKS